MTRYENYTLDDQFGFEPYVDALYQHMTSIDVGELPLVIGVYGAWGTGKTSFMRQLELKATEGTSHITPLRSIWFDAWKYDRVEDVRSALIYKILITLRKLTDDDAVKKIISEVVNQLKIIRQYFRKAKLSASIGFAKVQFDSVANTEESLHDDFEQFETEVETFSQAFAKAVQAYVDHSDTGKLIIFLDDLDRCLPEGVISVLESLKIFMDEAPVVFVIGVDRTVVESAIIAHYGIEAKIQGRDYLDKIVHVPFSIPPVSAEAIGKRFEKIANAPDPVFTIANIAALGNPRTYLRICRLLNSTLPIAQKLMDLHANFEPGIETRILMRNAYMLVIAIQVRFPQLYEVAVRDSENFAKFAELFRSRGNPSEDDLINLLPNYYKFYGDMDIRVFLFDLYRGIQGDANPAQDVHNGIMSLNLRISERLQ